MSRIGSAGGTYLMPLALTALGAGGALGVGAAVTAVGLVVAIFMAPETRGVALSESAGSADTAAGEQLPAS